MGKPVQIYTEQLVHHGNSNAACAVTCPHFHINGDDVDGEGHCTLFDEVIRGRWRVSACVTGEAVFRKVAALNDLLRSK